MSTNPIPGVNPYPSEQDAPPPPPPPVDATVTVAVSKDKRSAALLLTPPQFGGRPVTQAMLQTAITTSGVIFGIRADTVAQMVYHPVYDSAVPFAQATLPVNGKDGSIEYLFSSDREFRPQMRADGTVDYKELGDLPNVRKGDVLATLVRGEPGTPGTDVLGNPIPAKPGKTPRLGQGKNTILDAEGLNLLANLDGQVTKDASGKVFVSNTYTVDGDVDTSTGNITFVGHVVVHGSVKTGYTVRADGNITVRGCVEGGSVYAGGSVVIGDGYLGNDNSEIVAGGNLQCKHIHHGTVSVDGSLETDRLYHSHIRCGGSVRMTSNRSTIIGGTLHSRYDVEVFDVGSRMGSFVTLIEAGSDPKVGARAQGIPLEEQQLAKRLNDVSRVAEVLTQLQERGRLAPERQDEYNKVMFTLQSLRQRQAELMEEKVELAEQAATLGYGNIIIRGAAYPGVQVVIGPEIMKINTITNATKFSRGQDGIVTAPSS